MKRGVAALVLGFGWCTTLAQCPVTNFSIPGTACLGERLSVANSSDPGSYEWDFCTGDFLQAPSAEAIGNLTGVNGRPGIEFAFDTKWYAFVTGTFSNRFYRLDFDAGLDENPTAITNLGTLGGAIDQPGQIRILKEAGQWYGLLHNTGGNLIKLSFGSQLSNTPSATTLITGVGYINSGLAVGNDPVHGYVCVLSGASNQFSIIRLGPTLSVPNPVSDVIVSSTVPNPNSLGDLDLVYSCGSWFAVAVNLGNGNLYRLDFGNSLFSAPSITQVHTLSATNPGRLRLAREGDRYYFLALALDATLTKGDFGADLTSVPVLTNEGSLGGVLTAGMYGLGLVKENSTWTVLGANQASGQYFKIHYSDNCQATPKTSTAFEPVVAYAAPGTFYVSLHNTVSSSAGSAVRLTTVSSLSAPDISFSSMNNCALHDVLFTSINLSGDIVSYDWDFGDGQGSPVVNPLHAYASAGTWEPHLVVSATNGCSNQASGTLDVYNEPAADFLLPPLTPVCTNQTYSFTNLTVFDPGSLPMWEWRINGALVSTQANLSATFASPTPQEIRLKAIIPGCENEMTKNIATVLNGPMVSFDAPDDCAGSLVSFTNATSGADAGYSWDFGDGSPASTLAEPDHAYTNAGTYQVMLTASNVAGCNNSLGQDIIIYSVPQPDFSIGLPPFSCSNSPTLFQNDTPDLTDSNIIFWFWEFGDTGSSTSTQRDPAFTYSLGGGYSVILTATSDAGCTKDITKMITIGTSPEADFANGPACLNQLTQFVDLSAGGVTTRTWQIGALVLSGPNPTHTFTMPGTHMVTLTVTGSGGCNDLITKPLDVPVVQTLVLDVENPCANQPATFTLLNNTSPPLLDNVIGWQWNIAGVLSNGNPVNEAITLAGLSPVSVMTTHASGCVYTKMESVMIHASPVANFTAAPQQGNAPLTVQFSNTSTGATQYQWIFTGNPPGFSTDASPVHTFLELGDYAAELTAVNDDGCQDIMSIPIQVLVPALDLVLMQFTLAPDGLTGKLRPAVTVKNKSNVPVTVVEIAIHLSDQATVTELLNVSLAAGESTTRTLTLTLDPRMFAASFVCAEVLSEKDVVKADNRQCINFDEGDFVFNPYPNPSLGILHVDWISAIAGTATIIIYNSQGRREYSWETPSAVGLNQSVHDVSLLASGMYVVTVHTSTAVQSRRFVRP